MTKSITQRLPKELQSVVMEYVFDAKTDYARVIHQFKMRKLTIIADVIWDCLELGTLEDLEEVFEDEDGYVNDYMMRYYFNRFKSRRKPRNMIIYRGLNR